MSSDLDIVDAEAEIARRKAAEKVDRERDLNDLRWVLSDKKGRRFIWRLLSDFGIFRQSYVGGPNSASDTAFNEGLRNAGHKLLEYVNDSSPHAYSTMAKEAQGEEHV